jgi:hypothetical protein
MVLLVWKLHWHRKEAILSLQRIFPHPPSIKSIFFGGKNKHLENSGECLAKLKKYFKQNITDGCKVNEDTYVTYIKNMTLVEYINAMKKHCKDLNHGNNCPKCEPSIEAANIIMEKGIVPLSSLYRQCFGVVYRSDRSDHSVSGK